MQLFRMLLSFRGGDCKMRSWKLYEMNFICIPVGHDLVPTWAAGMMLWRRYHKERPSVQLTGVGQPLLQHQGPPKCIICHWSISKNKVRSSEEVQYLNILSADKWGAREVKFMEACVPGKMMGRIYPDMVQMSIFPISFWWETDPILTFKCSLVFSYFNWHLLQKAWKPIKEINDELNELVCVIYILTCSSVFIQLIETSSKET